MTEQDRSILKEKIATEILQLQNDVAQLEEITRPVSAEDMDEITRMDAIMNKSMNDAALNGFRARLAGLEYALKRIAEPEFGYCIECGEAIALPRLMAMPETAHCIECAGA